MLKPETLARYLKKRQGFVKDCFKDSLPDIVAESQFIVGRKDADSPVAVYEIQPKFSDYVDLGAFFHGFMGRISIDGHEWDFVHIADIIKWRFEKEKIPSIKQQLEAFGREMRRISEEHGKVIDIWGSGNVIITAEGQLKIIDTDNLPDTQEIVSLPSQPEKIRASMQMRSLAVMLQALEQVIKKLDE